METSRTIEPETQIPKDINLEGLVIDAPYNSKNLGFVIPFKIKSAKRELGDKKAKITEVVYTLVNRNMDIVYYGGALPIFNNDRLRVSGLLSLGRGPAYAPSKIELLDDEGKIKAVYNQ